MMNTLLRSIANFRHAALMVSKHPLQGLRIQAMAVARDSSLSLAEALYESYAAACAAIKGAQLPAWGALSRDEQTCWISATTPLQGVELRLSQQLAQAKSELAEMQKRLLKLEKDRELELRHTRCQELLRSWRG